jgi:hypothetical protein
MVEADLEIAFGLLDLAKDEWELGDQDSAVRALHDAEEVYKDIEKRLAALGAEGSAPFEGIVGELRRQMDERKGWCSGPFS